MFQTVGRELLKGVWAYPRGKAKFFIITENKFNQWTVLEKEKPLKCNSLRLLKPGKLKRRLDP
jgi:hypothetical protein